jgi:hypothetical protein
LAAQAAYSARLAEFEKQSASPRAIGGSVRLLTAPVPGKPGTTRMLPYLVQPEASGDALVPGEGSTTSKSSKLGPEGRDGQDNSA